MDGVSASRVICGDTLRRFTKGEAHPDKVRALKTNTRTKAKFAHVTSEETQTPALRTYVDRYFSGSG